MKYDEIVGEFQNNIFGTLTTIRSNKEQNKIWFLGVEIQRLLGHKNITQAIKDAKLHSHEKFVLNKQNNPKFWNEFLLEKNIDKRTRNLTLISESGVVKLIASTNKIINKEVFLNELGLKLPNFIVLKTRKEIDFGFILIDYCNELNIKLIHQYSVNNYRIDYYLPELNIGIEFDEKYHNNETQKLLDFSRENEIKNKLNIDIIRISEDLSSLGILFSKITKLILEKNK